MLGTGSWKDCRTGDDVAPASRAGNAGGLPDCTMMGHIKEPGFVSIRKTNEIVIKGVRIISNRRRVD